MKITVLGSGTSSGVPRVDGDWGDCDPSNPRNRRRRVSILVQHSDTRILVDTSPDLREQLLAEGGGRPSAVIWTHEHADHCHGIDDLRPFFFQGGAVPGYARPRTLDALETSFQFALKGRHGYPPYVRVSALPDVIIIGGVTIRAFDLPHGQITTAGLRFDVDGLSAVYTTDFNGLPDDAAALIRGVDIWIVDAVRERPHPTHPHLAQVLAWIDALKPRRAVLTHMDQSMDYARIAALLPGGVEPGYDGLEIVL